MKYNPAIHHRRSIRLKGYDYSQAGAYFITICTHNRQCLFGHIKDAEMILNDAGKIANECWLQIPEHFPKAILHEHIVMPNHIHGIIELVGANNYSPDQHNMTNNHSPDKHNMTNNHSPDKHNRANNHSPGEHDIANNDSPGQHNRANDYSPLPLPFKSPSKTIGSIIRGYKIGVTKWFRSNTNIETVWQRNYHEHIIRNEQSCETISNYIINNPAKWTGDKFFKE